MPPFKKLSAHVLAVEESDPIAGLNPVDGPLFMLES
jgi:hypothetical protein